MQDASRTVVVGSRVGLHSRPAKLVAEAAAKQPTIVKISKDGGNPVDARSLLSILALGAKKGDEVTLLAEGDEASASIQALAALIEQDLDEDDA
jgi:phosphocarrier protein HPr